MTEDQIKHMVNRFLAWKLPETFNPDGGVSFEPVGNAGTQHAYRREPSGTNLLDYTQATAMVRHMLDGLPQIAQSEIGWVIERGDSQPSQPTYWAGLDVWSQDHMDAVRFARKEDGERVSARMTYPNNRVCEHAWG
jgi:hypothetical protein